MHINGWVHASDLMKRIKSANSISTFSSEEGLPDNHVITIRERELTVDFPELIQNNIKTDTVTLDLDAEWDGIHPVIIFGPNASGTIAVEYTGEPVHIPGAVMQYVGGLDCSVMGLDDSGEVRLVTKAAPNTFEVVESGEYIGQISEDDVSLLGQILSAIEDVETATSDASNAAEAATAAANSANTAAAKATNAANSANTAATKATAAANSANSASERAENAYDVLTPIIAEIGVNGNQPRATTNPNHVATASDAYAAKPLGISIKGETRQNLWSQHRDTAYTGEGITYTPNADGSETISGTPSGIRPASLYGGQFYILRPDSTYTVSVNIPPGTGNFIGVRINGGFSGFACTDNKTSHTFTTPSSISTVEFGFYGTSLKAGTYHVMLNEGSTAQPWCPPGLNSVQPENLVTAVKNLVAVDDVALSEPGFCFINLNVDGLLPSGVDLVFSFDANLEKSATAQFYINSDNSTNINTRLFNTFFAAVNGKNKIAIAKLSIPAVAMTMFTNAIGEYSNFQLELGSTATAYEPPNVTTTPLPEVELRSLPNGTCDELVIRADGTCEVERRTVQVTFDGSEDENWALNVADNGHGIANFRTESNKYTTSKASTICDTLPIDNAIQVDATTAGILMADKSLYLRLPSTTADTVEELKTWLEANPTTVVFTNAYIGTTEPQSPVTLPTLPSPNITVYHDSDVPSDITVEYVQDINIVLDNLNAKIAALNIAQSISS